MSHAIASSYLLGCVLLLGSGATTPAAAQPAASTAVPCSAAEYRQFDFWVGEWDVTTPDGKPAGTNSVTRPLGACALHEHWKGAGGMTGESYNVYDRVTQQWHQTWVDDRGTLLLLDGGLVEGDMVLSGPERLIAGKPTRDRITWRPKAADEVHQVWEQSADKGKTWSIQFFGVYKRRK